MDHYTSDVPQKQCTRCNQLFPATADFYTRDKTRPDGLFPWCKQCKKRDDKEYYVANKEHVIERVKEYREEHKEQISEYQKHYRYRHAERLALRGKRYREEHKEYLQEWKRQHYLRHRESIREQHHRYNAANRAAIRKKNRNYYYANYQQSREQRNRKQREYYLRHIVHRREMSRGYQHKRRALKMATGGSYTVTQLQEQFQRQKGKCYYCHVKFGRRRAEWHVEHVVPLSRGGTNDISNIVISCPTCNLRKGDKLPHEWSDGGRLL